MLTVDLLKRRTVVKEKDLRKTLKHGIGHKKGVGEYKYDSGETGREVSYHTSKPNKMSKRRFGKVMRRLGRKHGQESVFTKTRTSLLSFPTQRREAGEI